MRMRACLPLILFYLYTQHNTGLYATLDSAAAEAHHDGFAKMSSRAMRYSAFTLLPRPPLDFTERCCYYCRHYGASARFAGATVA